MIYVCPVAPPLRGLLLPHNRLYAFPSTPEPEHPKGFIILDSGAFGLAQRGLQMSKAHMTKLAAHYRMHQASDAMPRLAVAPDAFPNPSQTIRQWHYWHSQNYPRVAPVIQMTALHEVNVFATKMQCLEYKSYAPRSVFISNPSLRGTQAYQLGFRKVIDTVRDILEPKWVHILGAGWSLEDVKDWKRVGGWDSIDSIAYYTDASRGIAWDRLTYTSSRDTAIRNANAANAALQQ